MSVAFSYDDDENYEQGDIPRQIKRYMNTFIDNKFAVIDEKIELILKRINHMDETTLAELKDIKALLSGTKSEIQICQETQTMPPPSPQTPNLLGQPSPFMYSSTKDAHDQFFNSRPVGVFDAALNGGIPRKDVSKNSSQQTIDEHYASAAIATDPQCTNAFELQQELNESIPNIDLTSMNVDNSSQSREPTPLDTASSLKLLDAWKSRCQLKSDDKSEPVDAALNTASALKTLADACNSSFQQKSDDNSKYLESSDSRYLPFEASKNPSQQKIGSSASLNTDPQSTNAFEPQQEVNESIPNIAEAYPDLLELSPVKNARFGESRQKHDKSLIDLPKPSPIVLYSPPSSVYSEYTLSPSSAKVDGIDSDEFLEGFAPLEVTKAFVNPDVGKNQDVDACDNTQDTEVQGEKIQEDLSFSCANKDQALDDLISEQGKVSTNEGIAGAKGIQQRYITEYILDDVSEPKSDVSVIADEDEYDNQHFEIETAKSDEEVEDELFKSECKLFTFCCETKQNFELGMGDIFILYNFKQNLYQVLMRRNRDQKICANFTICGSMLLSDKAGNKNTGIFRCDDCSDGELKPTIFIVRFREKDLYDEFKKIFNDAVENVRLSFSNDGVLDESSRKLNEAKETGVPFKRQRIPQSGTANLDASVSSVATFKTPATPPKSFATFTSVKSETSFSSQFPISSNRTTPLPPPRHRLTENALDSTLTSEFADNEIVAGDFSKLSFR